MNVFDAVVVVIALAVMTLGFMSGLLRGLATIFAYVIAVPAAALITPLLWPLVATGIAPQNAWIPAFVVMMGLGIPLGALFRIIVNEMVGSEKVSLPDRAAGAFLGALRVFVIAVLVVIVFDRIIPADRQPAFLIGSKLRPYLSAAGHAGVQSLPPEVDAYIERVKRERGL
ncbi:MAG TPA: CvpA family protein [Xanthobacteraceae bacterium]|jgi:membrane protein required for colicin V production|nr:CvpA family protein [Xanthobacteraceae bacterium]